MFVEHVPVTYFLSLLRTSTDVNILRGIDKQSQLIILMYIPIEKILSMILITMKDQNWTKVTSIISWALKYTCTLRYMYVHTFPYMLIYKYT